MQRTLLATVALVATAWGAAPALAQAGGADAAERPALMARAPSRAFLLGIAQAGKRLVAVGERGVIILSDDAGRNWRQARVPASVTLTAVQFVSPSKGWAVGHSGIVLHSADGGEHWEHQLDGVQAAGLALQAAQARSGAGAGADAALAEAQRLVKDGADKPFLALHFSDELHGIVAGAYNLLFQTVDGGRHWTPMMDRLDNPKAMHLYAMASAGDVMVVAGEQGSLFRSADAGQHFERVGSPYKGSFFAVTALPSGEFIVGGLRGNAFRSSHQGRNWERLEGASPVSFIAARNAGPLGAVLANQAGQMFVAGADGGALRPLPLPPTAPVNDMAVLADGSVVAVGMAGAHRLETKGAALPPHGDVQ
ncbi:MAG: YCF48-related protein [Pseudomonadota bacterium]